MLVLASARDKDQCALKHSPSSRLIKDSTKQLSVGSPGRLMFFVTPFA
jgi:hypothetical protein